MVQSKSKYFNAYYNHVLNKEKTKGNLGKVFDLIANLSDRRGLGDEWYNVDADVQDELIDTWHKILE